MKQNYVLVSPARNEAAYLPGVIESVLAQTIPPLAWVVVSDGSTDATDAIVGAAAQSHQFIQLIRVEGEKQRSFGSKARAFQMGCEILSHLHFDCIGNLDADVTFGPRYYEGVLLEMERRPRLGVASGVCWEKSRHGFKVTTINLDHAAGMVQFFRRECFEAIGGYQPMSVGGVDALAEFTARMRGWETRAFPDLPFYHHKPIDSANARSASGICYRAGLTEYHIGTYPLFALAKAAYRWRENPVILSMFIRLIAYARLWIAGTRRDASDELVAYMKSEQTARLKNALRGWRGPRRCPSPEVSADPDPATWQ